MPRVLFFYSWSCYYLPNLPLIAVITHQQPQEISSIQPVRLYPPLASVYLDARRIHHQVIYTLAQQIPMYPEPVTACFITALDLNVVFEAKTPLCFFNLSLQLLQVPCFNSHMTLFIAVTKCQSPG